MKMKTHSSSTWLGGKTFLQATNKNKLHST